MPPFLLLWLSVANALDAVDTAQSQAMIDFLDSCHAAAKLNQPFRFDPRLAKDLQHLDYSR